MCRYHEREAQNLAQACGVSRVLIKPWSNAEILRAVDQVMAGVTESLPQMVSDEFDREHVRLLTDKLAERADALAASNARGAGIVVRDAITSSNIGTASEFNEQLNYARRLKYSLPNTQACRSREVEVNGDVFEAPDKAGRWTTLMRLYPKYAFDDTGVLKIRD